MQPIPDIAAKLGITEDDLIPYGRSKAKVELSVLDRPRARDGAGKSKPPVSPGQLPCGEPPEDERNGRAKHGRSMNQVVPVCQPVHWGSTLTVSFRRSRV